MITITVGASSFNLSAEQVKALEWDIYNVKDWLENAVQVKIASVCDKLIITNSSKNPTQMAYSAKITEVMSSGYDLSFGGSAVDIIVASGEVISLTADEATILELTEAQINTWVENIVTNKARSCINTIVKLNTTERLETLSADQKDTIVSDATILSAYDRMNQSGMI